MENTIDKRIDLIGLLISEVTLDTEKYSALQLSASNVHAKELLKGIYLDKIKHKTLLEEMFFNLSHKSFLPLTHNKRQILDYKKQLQKNIFDETNNAKFFGSLYTLFDNTPYLSSLFIIVNDLHSHALTNLYLYLKV